MFKMLIDATVWLHLARDPKMEPALAILEDLVEQGRVELLLPRMVLEGFKRGRYKVALESADVLLTHIRLVRESLERRGKSRGRVGWALKDLEKAESSIRVVGGEAVDMLDRIEKLLDGAGIIEPSDDVRINAALRAVEGREPFQKGRNEMGNAILIEMYAEQLLFESDRNVRFVFVTHQAGVFGDPGECVGSPHPGFKEYFDNARSFFEVHLPQAIAHVDPKLVSDELTMQAYERDEREDSKILAAIHQAQDQVRYHRFREMRSAIENGTLQVVDRDNELLRPGATDTIWKGRWENIVAEAADIEQRYGDGELGPWNEYQWGMINGKLSTLHWVKGDEWDAPYLLD